MDFEHGPPTGRETIACPTAGPPGERRFVAVMNDAPVPRPAADVVDGALPRQSRKGGKLPLQSSGDQAKAARDTRTPERSAAPPVSAAAVVEGVSAGATGIRDIKDYLIDGRIGVACRLAMDLLDARVAAGDTELSAAKQVIQHCLWIISAMPPLSHIGSVPLRPDDRLYTLFDHFLSLLRQQESQMQELQTMINELI
jgi:hypothetical protein